MKLREYLNAADIYLFMIIMSTTFLISIYSISNYIFSNSGGFNKTVMLYLYFTTGTGRETVIFTGIFFILSLFIILYFNTTDSVRKEMSDGKSTYSEIFLLTFIGLIFLSYNETTVPDLQLLFGNVGVTAYYEQTAIFFSIIMITVGLISLIPLALLKDTPVVKTIMSGNKYKIHYYLYSSVPAVIATFILYLNEILNLNQFVIMFLIFFMLFVFMQRNGLFRTISAVFLIFGSQIISSYFVSITETLYLLFVILLLGLGFATLSIPEVRQVHHDSSNEEIHKTTDPENATTQNTTLKMKDSRSIPEALFIRGSCTHCESVEFYIKGNILECKKCKSEHTGKENEFNSFLVSENKRGI